MVPSSAALTLTVHVVRRISYATMDMLLILRPFSLPVWIATILMAILLTAILACYAHGSPMLVHNIGEEEHPSRINLCQIASLAMASAFSMAKLQITPITVSSRIFALLLWLFTFLILVLYICGMIVILLHIKHAFISEVNSDDILSQTKKEK